MIIVNAGGYKTGSTWVSNILSSALPKAELLKIEPLSADALDPSIICPKKSRAMLAALLKRKETSNKRMQAKIHCYGLGEAALSALAPHEDIYYLATERSLRDVLVSRYYHQLNSGYEFENFSDFLNQHGQVFVYEAISIRRFWRKMKKRYPERVHIIRYESLHKKYLHEVSALMTFLNYEEWSKEGALAAQTLTSNKVRFQKEWMPENFYRKGIIGDHKNHFRAMDSIRYLRDLAVARLKLQGMS